MKWDLEERTEDAFQGYLKRKVPGTMRVYTSWEFHKPQLPCVVVHAGSTEPVSEDAQWHDYRRIMVDVSVMVEATDKDLRKVREINAEMRSHVGDALAIDSLLDEIVDIGVDDIAFSMAQLLGTLRSVDERTLVTTFQVETYSEPVEGS